VTAAASKAPRAVAWGMRRWVLSVVALGHLGLGVLSACVGLAAPILALLAAACRVVPRLGASTWWVSARVFDALGRWESWRFASFGGVVVRPLAQAGRSDLIGTDGRTWRAALYWVVRPFLAALQTVLVALVVCAPLVVLVAQPLAWGNAHRRGGGWMDSSWPQGWIASWSDYFGDSARIVGGVLLPGAVLVMSGPVLHVLVTLDGWTALALLGSQEELLADRVNVLEGSRARAVDAAEAERLRIERDLHDGAQQRLVALTILLGRAQAQLADREPGVRTLLAEAKAEARAAVTELRDITRGLRPPVLVDRGLDAALSAVAARFPWPVRIDIDLEPRPSLTVESVLYFAISECLANVAKHAHAGRAAVRVCRATPDRAPGIRATWIVATITDDGVGGADPTGRAGSGLAGLTDRLAGVDGLLHVSSPPGGPTVITIEVPDVH